MVHSAGARISSNWDFVRDLNPLPWGSEKSPGAEKDISNLFSKPSKPIAETAMATVQTERNTKETRRETKIIVARRGFGKMLFEGEQGLIRRCPWQGVLVSCLWFYCGKILQQVFCFTELNHVSFNSCSIYRNFWWLLAFWLVIPSWQVWWLAASERLWLGW